MNICARTVLFLSVLVFGFAGLTANATTWDFEGVVTQCNQFACDLAGITVGQPLAGFLVADDAASGPNSTFGPADITDYGLAAQGVTVGPTDSTIVSATLTTDAAGELSAGVVLLAGQADGGVFGIIDLDVTVDVGASTWMIETDFLGLGVVASGPGTWTLEVDGDGIPAIQDNCTNVANPAQRDTDADGIGNFCDPDLDQNCFVTFPDLSIMSANFFVPGDLNTDFDGSGQTNFADLAIMSQYFFSAPGPSGVPNSCSP